MKKILVISLVGLMLTSCATVFGGHITEYQKIKPSKGEPQREVRIVALVADIITFPLSLVVDFATGAIYKPRK